MDTYLVVGLGNPGNKYARTRHNVGFDVVELLSAKTSIRLSKRRGKALIGEGIWHGKRLILAQPQTYMNLSGESVVALVSWYKPGPDGLVLIYDDIDLPLGTVRVRATGSPGTHNGMRSVIGLLGRSDFPRVRVGIGKPPDGWDLADWVTTHYPTPEDRQTAFGGYMLAADAVLELIENGVDACMRTFNKKAREPQKEDA